MIALIEAGADLTEAARHAGVDPRTARVLAETDPRVAEALGAGDSGAISRQTAYLAALLTMHGGRGVATRQAGVSSSATVAYWRSDELFRAAEDALRAYAKNRLANHRRRVVTKEKLEQYLALVGEGLTLSEAADRCGISVDTVNRRAHGSPEFAERLAAAREQAKVSGAIRARREAVIQERLERFLAALAEGLTVTAAAKLSGISANTVYQSAHGSPEFAERFAAAREQAKTTRSRHMGPVGERQREDFLAEVARGARLKDAARHAGLTLPQISRLRGSDPEFDQRLQELRPNGSRSARKPFDGEQLGRLWAGELPLTQIAKILDVSVKTVGARAEKLGLGPRPRRVGDVEKESTT